MASRRLQSGVTKVVGAFRPNAEAGAVRESKERTTQQQGYAAEFSARENRTWWDSFADGMNRLVRPVLAGVIMYPVIYTSIDPISGAQIFTALAVVPEFYWYIVLSVIGFYFAARTVEKVKNINRDIAASQERVNTVVHNIKKLSELRPGAAEVREDITVDEVNPVLKAHNIPRKNENDPENSAN